MSVFVIAEAGVNHNGSLEMAKQLVDAAVAAKADAVKFQTFKAVNLVTEEADQATYQTENTGIKESQLQMLQRLELSAHDHEVLFAYCQQLNIEFMSTAFDDDSITLLRNLGMKRWKIPSGELLSIPYLRKIAAFNEPTILSTGMGSLQEVLLAKQTLLDAGLRSANLTILHANTAYPTPYKDVNLKAMSTIEQACQVPVGLSDHSLGIEVPVAAVALGAKVIEKHFTLDRNLPGPDHKASLEPDELAAMVRSIRHVELALGTGIKQPSQSEAVNIQVARKRIVATQPIETGDAFTVENIGLKRAQSGYFAEQWDTVLGSEAPRNYQVGEGVEW